jgi:ABC-type sugar transport system substrate-binding protein
MAPQCGSRPKFNRIEPDGGSMVWKMNRFAQACGFGMALFALSCTLVSGAQSTTAPEASATPQPAAATEQDTAAPEQPTATVQPEAPEFSYADMVVGFLQSGTTDDWHAANTKSFQETALTLGIKLKYYDSQSNAQNQKTQFGKFLSDPEINVIVLGAVDPSGWDSLLRDAKSKGITVVLEDRTINAASDLYAAYVGPDFVEEGRLAADALCRTLEGSSAKNVVELAGSAGSSAASDRAEGFRENMTNCGIEITKTRIASWSTEGGRLVMAGFLAQSRDIQGVFAQNDAMVLGAIQAIKAAGLRPGMDIKLVSIDATRAGFEAMIAGELNAAVECTPMFAPQVYEAALKALNGEPPEEFIASHDELIWAEDAAGLIGSRDY